MELLANLMLSQNCDGENSEMDNESRWCVDNDESQGKVPDYIHGEQRKNM